MMASPGAMVSPSSDVYPMAGLGGQPQVIEMFYELFLNCLKNYS